MAEHRLCPLDDIADGEARRIDVGPTRVCVVRLGDEVHAIGDRCTHADVSLAEGEVYADEKMIECWKHGSRFSLVDGHPDCLPATQPEPVFPARVDAGEIIVELPDE